MSMLPSAVEMGCGIRSTDANVRSGWSDSIKTAEDVERMAELVRQFASIAERLGTREIATLDRRHFPSITPKDGGHFTLLPETLP